MRPRISAFTVSPLLVRLLVALGLLAGLLASPALAEEPPTGDAPVTASEDENPPAPTEAPAPPTQAPPPPTAVPTEAPPPTAVPTDVPPSTAPPTAVPVEPTVAPTEPPAPTETPGEEPTAEPTDVPADQPLLDYTLADEPECSRTPGQPEAIASGGTLEYDCTGRLDLRGSDIVPAGITVTWSVRAEVEGGWAVQLLPPRNHPDDPVEWTALQGGEATFNFDQDDPAGTASEPGELDQQVGIAYRLRVMRPACATDSQPVRLEHDVAVGSPGAVVTGEPVSHEPLRLAPVLQPIPEPSVTFTGGLDFGSVGATASGLLETSRAGTLTADIAGLDRACGDWNLQLGASPLTGAGDEPLAGASLVVTAVDGVALPDGGCDLVSGCQTSIIASGPDAPATRTIVLTVTLHMPERASLGTFSTTLDATLRPAGADPVTGSPRATQE